MASLRHLTEFPHQLRYFEAKAIELRRSTAREPPENDSTAAPAATQEGASAPKEATDTGDQADGVPRCPTVPDDGKLPADCIGLALSGGGIRSATFCLGVLQALAKAGRLRMVDYLSTVSGGGYTGAFLGRMFADDRVQEADQTQKTKGARQTWAQQVECVLGNSRSDQSSWLRNNGRYLSPNGAGDSALAAAIIVRNLVAVHTVLATLLMAFFLVLLTIRAVFPGLEGLSGQPTPTSLWWWSPSWILPALLTVLWVIPAAGAYWLTHVDTSGGTDRLQFRVPLLIWAGAAMWIGLHAPLGSMTQLLSTADSRAATLVAMGAVLTLAIWIAATARPAISGRDSTANPKSNTDDEDRTGPRDVPVIAFLVLLVFVLAGVVGFLLRAPSEIESRLQLPAWSWSIGPVPSFLLVVLAPCALGLLVLHAGRRAEALCYRWSERTQNAATDEVARRRRVRRNLSVVLQVGCLTTLAFAAVTLVDSFGQTAYLVLAERGPAGLLLLPPIAIVTTVLAFASKIVPWLQQLVGSGRWKIRWGLVSTLTTILMMGVLATGIATASHALCWDRIGTRGGSGVAPEVELTASEAGGPAKITRSARSVESTDSDGTVTVATTDNRVVETAAAPAASPEAPGYRLPWRHTIVVMSATLVVALLFSHCIYFLNLSSLLTLYSARLARAYLGASNRARWKGAGRNVTHPIDGDGLSMDEYRPHEHGGPLHLINVTVNETVSGESQIEHRDRKGLPMAIGPCGVTVGRRHHALWATSSPGKDTRSGTRIHTRWVCAIECPDPEESPFHLFKRKDGGPEPQQVQSRSLEQWVAVSGAAFTTGLGWRTSLGASMFLTLGNVRLGHWWDSHIKGSEREDHVPLGVLGRLGEWFSFRCPVYSYLLNELLARFHGPGRQYWYLSDGGHSENTACYELIRRRVRTIICCDCGADPRYLFDDISNLTRRVRVDFGAEIRFVSAKDVSYRDRKAMLRLGIGLPEELCVPSEAGADTTSPEGCGRPAAHATLAFVYYPDDADDGRLAEKPGSVILFIKPTVTGDEPRDVLHYQDTHPDFPQETTIDQFFDEAQWESYRRLGQHVGKPLFSDRACKLWRRQTERRLSPNP